MELPSTTSNRHFPAARSACGSPSSNRAVEAVARPASTGSCSTPQHRRMIWSRCSAWLQACGQYPYHPCSGSGSLERRHHASNRTSRPGRADGPDLAHRRRGAAEAAVAACRYSPRGIRGMGGTTRATMFSRRVPGCAQKAHEQTCVLVRTARALDNLEAICAVDGGVDGVRRPGRPGTPSLGHTGASTRQSRGSGRRSRTATSGSDGPARPRATPDHERGRCPPYPRDRRPVRGGRHRSSDNLPARGADALLAKFAVAPVRR
jgi:hypothetical protein